MEYNEENLRNVHKEGVLCMANRDFFNKISNTLQSAGKDGLVKAKELKDAAKITVEIKEREASIHKMYRELGKAYYTDHKNDLEPEYEDRLAAIRAAYEEIGELKASKDEIRGIKRCPGCGGAVAPEASFCGTCGEKCEDEVVECEIVPEEDEEAEAPAEEAAEEAPAEEVPVEEAE